MCACTLLLWVFSAIPALAQSKEIRFGAIDAFFDAGRADELGITWSRLMFPWQRVQRTGPKEFLPAISEDIINDEVRRGRKIAGVLVNTPDWAATSLRRTLTSPPRNLDLPIDHPDNYWAAYCKRTAEFYKGRVDTWIIWNEPDVWDEDHPGFTWSGSVEEFYKLQKVAYLAIKAGNPDAKVVLPGLTYWWDKRGDKTSYLQRLLDVAVKDPQAPLNNWFFDAAVVQLYNEPQLLYDVPNEYRRTMIAHGVDKPIWINETNVAPWDDFGRPLTRAHYRASFEEQSNFLVQAYAYALAANVERIQLYKLRDEDTWQFGWETYGVVRADRSVRPAFKTLQMIHRLFDGVHGGTVNQEQWATAINLSKADERVLVVWTRGPRPVTMRIRAGGLSATIYQRDGSSRQVASSGGMYQVDLEAATHNTIPSHPEKYQIGGPPLILIEKGVPKTSPDFTLTLGALIGPPDDPVSAIGRAIESIRLASPVFR